MSGTAPRYVTVELTQISCGQCGGAYAISERYRKEKEEKGGGWNCPYCKVSWGFFGGSEAERLRKQLEAANETADFLRRSRAREQASHRATKGHLTRLKKRASAGVCAFCNRTFQNVARHVACKHPGQV